MRHLSVLTAPLCRVTDLTVETLRGWLGSLRKSLVVLVNFFPSQIFNYRFSDYINSTSQCL